MNADSIRAYADRLSIRVLPGRNVDGWVDGFCPLAPWTHRAGADRNPSFGISISNTQSNYHCFSCKQKGSLAGLAFKLARLRNDKSLVAIGDEIQQHEILGGDAVVLGDWDSSQRTDNSRGTSVIDAKSAFTQYPAVAVSIRAMAYLRKRGISAVSASRMQLRWDAQQQRVLFPVWRDDGKLAGFSGRSLVSNTAKGNNPKVRDYYGLTKESLMLSLRGGPHTQKNTGFALTCKTRAAQDAVIVVEGLIDFARMVSLGFNRTAAIMGSHLTHGKFRIIEGWARSVIHMPDNDLAGRVYLYGASDPEKGIEHDGHGALNALFGMVPQLVAHYPEGFTDPGETPPQLIMEAIDNAELYTG